MRIALVDGSKKGSRYPVGLLKIGAWQKSLGNHCQLYINSLPEKDEFDEIWVSTLFTYEIKMARGIIREAKKRAKVVRVGGIAASLLPEEFKKEDVEVTIGMIPEAELFQPDYSLLGFTPEYSIAYTTRGCVRKCEFCMVHRLEPKYEHRGGWENGIHPNSKHIQFYDNNYTAKKPKEMQIDLDKLKKIYATTGNTRCDFNQAIDCRLITEEKAKILGQMIIDPFRMAFDDMSEDGHLQKAMRLLHKYGAKGFMMYVLFNFKDTPEDLYYRLKEIIRMGEELDVGSIAFPMRYQPILDKDSARSYTGENWTEMQKKNFMTLVAAQAINGIINSGNIKKFEYWFMETPEQFAKYLKWDGLHKHVGKKAGLNRHRNHIRILKEKEIKNAV